MRGHQLQPDDADVHVRIVHQGDHGFAQQLGARDELAGDVDRIAGGAEGRHHGGEPRLCRGAKRRHREADFLGAVRHHDAGATRLRRDAETIAFGDAFTGQRLQHVEHLLFVAGAQHAELADDRVEHRIGHRQRAGVRRGGAHAGGHAADFGEHQRLLQFLAAAGEPDQLLPVFEALEITGRDPHARVLDHGHHQLGKGDVGLVAGVDEIAESQAALTHQRGDSGAEGAGLRDEGDGAGRRRAVRVLAEGRVDILKGVDEAQAVGAAQHHAERLGLFRQRLFHRFAGRAHFAEAGGEDHHRADAALAERFDVLQDVVRRHGDDRQIGGLGQRFDRRVTGDAGDLRILRVNKENAAVVALADQVLERPAADLGEVGGSANDGDAARIDQPRDDFGT